MKVVCSSMMVIWFAVTDIRFASYKVEPVRNASGSVYALYRDCDSQWRLLFSGLVDLTLVSNSYDHHVARSAGKFYLRV